MNMRNKEWLREANRGVRIERRTIFALNILGMMFLAACLLYFLVPGVMYAIR